MQEHLVKILCLLNKQLMQFFAPCKFSRRQGQLSIFCNLFHRQGWFECNKDNSPKIPSNLVRGFSRIGQLHIFFLRSSDPPVADLTSLIEFYLRIKCNNQRHEGEQEQRQKCGSGSDREIMYVTMVNGMKNRFLILCKIVTV